MEGREEGGLNGTAGQLAGERAQAGTCPVRKIKEVTAQVQNLAAQPVTNQVIIQGMVQKQVFYVGVDNIVRHEAEEVPFSCALEVPGTAPGMGVVARAEVEYLIWRLSTDHARLLQQIVLVVQARVFAADGTVVGEASRQVLVEHIREFICVLKRPILVGAVFETRAQVLLVRELPLVAVKIKGVTAEVQDVTYRQINGSVVVSGVLHQQLYYVTTEGVVRLAVEDVAFTHALPLPALQPGASVEVAVKVEFLIPELLPVRGLLRLKVVLLIEVVAIIFDEVVQVVQDVRGPGIRVSRVAIRQDGRTVEVATDVTGPGIVRVERRTVWVEVVEDGTERLMPLQVVTEVVLSP